MNRDCEVLQLRLAENGAEVLAADAEVQAHCVECSGCFEYLEALQHLDPLLEALPELDVADDIVTSLLKRIEDEPILTLPHETAGKPRRLKGFLARPLGSLNGLFAALLKPGVFSPARTAMAGAFALILVLAYHMKDFAKPQRRHMLNAKPSQQGSGAAQQSADLFQAFKNEIDEQKRSVAEMRQDLGRDTMDLKEHKEKVTGIFESLVEKFENLQRETDSLAASLKQQQEAPTVDQAKNLDGPDGLDVFGYSDSTLEKDGGFRSPSAIDQDEGGTTGPVFYDKLAQHDDGVLDPTKSKERPIEGKVRIEPQQQKLISMSLAKQKQETHDKAEDSRKSVQSPEPLFIVAGGSASVTLLSSVNAPVDGTPYPAVFRLNGQISGPDGSLLNIGEARLIASAEGSEKDGRALFRLRQLSLQGADGKRHSIEVDGWIVGEDGVRGTKGKLVDKLGRLVMATASMQSLMAESDGKSGKPQSEDHKALNTVADALNEKLLNRSENVIPVVEVLPLRQLTAVFSRGAQIPASAPEQKSNENITDKTISSAEQFFRLNRTLEGLSFKDPHGYWANTYVPGDPTMRLLQTVLLSEDKKFPSVPSSPRLSLHQSVQQNRQPFDAPRDSAMAVYLHSEVSAIQGPTRFLLQVGLKGTEQKSGRRPAMNLAIVLDLRGAPLATETQDMLRDLLFAFNKAKDLGDRFSIFVAGREKSLLIDAGMFTHGQLTVALKELFQSPASESGAASITEVLEKAVAKVSGTDDPAAPLGSSAVLVVTPRDLSTEIDQLEPLAHKSAVSGIPVSVVGVGPEAEPRELDRLALAGQGTRRTLGASGDAATLVQKEIAAVSSTVARAIRLNIRLLPGVKLVDIIGSYKFDSQQSEQVREAENSIDRRLAKDLGLEADRGDDEDGIQIVIPGFHSGDEHVILLDVVADEPGPVAEVTARYKDLVHLRNGVAKANLNVASGHSQLGPLELNVIKNRLAFEFSSVLDRSSRTLDSKDSSAAVSKLEEFRMVLQSLGSIYPELARDAEIQADLSLIARYLELMKPSSDDSQLVSLADYLEHSLAYAGRLRINPRPMEP